MMHPESPIEPGTPGSVAESSLNALLEAAQDRLRHVLEEATRDARREVEAAATAIAARESEMAALEASLIVERVSIEATRVELAERIAAANQRRSVADARIEEAAVLGERATQALADALERSAQVIEESQARAHETESLVKARAEAELAEARKEAAEIRAQATARLDAVREESEGALRRAVELGMRVVSTAETTAERSRADLRVLVDHIEDYLRRETSEINLAASVVASPPSALGVEERAADDTSDRGDAGPETGEVKAGTVDDGAVDDGAVDPGVAAAVRRAVKDWSSTRQETR